MTNAVMFFQSAQRLEGGDAQIQIATDDNGRERRIVFTDLCHATNSAVQKDLQQRDPNIVMVAQIPTDRLKGRITSPTTDMVSEALKGMHIQ